MAKNYYVSENINEGSFEELSKILDVTFEMDYDSVGMPRDGVPLISDGHSARGYASEQPVMVVAATGSGKTRRLIMEYVISCIKSGTSMFVNDPKGELYRYSKALLEQNGYRVLVVDYRNPGYGERYNFCEHPAKLYQAGQHSRADEMFQSMFDTFMSSVKSEKDPYWHNTSSTYLTGLAQLACDILPLDMVTVNNIYEMHLQGGQRFGSITYMEDYLKRHKDKTYSKLISPYVSAPRETKSSLDSVLTSAISKFCRNDVVIDQTASSTFTIEELVEQKTALFIISRDESTVYNAFISVMVNQIHETLTDLAEEKYHGRLDRRFVFVLDEFGNLAPIDDINEKITVSRARNMGWFLGCQSLDQLKLKYGQDVAKIIIGNCNLAYMYSNDIDLLKMISELCGKTTDEFTHEQRPLLSVEQLRHFNKNEGETLFLLERMRPFIGFLPDISEYNVVPEEVLSLEKRAERKPKVVDFEGIVKEERKKLAEQPGKIEEMASSLGLPTFEEFMQMKKDAEEKREAVREPKRFSITIKTLGSSDKTTMAISEGLGVSLVEGRKILIKTMDAGNGVIHGLPYQKAKCVLDKLLKAGTVAVMKEEAA